MAGPGREFVRAVGRPDSRGATGESLARKSTDDRVFRISTALVLSTMMVGCSGLDLPFNPFSKLSGRSKSDEIRVNVEQAQLFREAETERAAQLIQEISRLQADL